MEIPTPKREKRQFIERKGWGDEKYVVKLCKMYDFLKKG